MWSRGAKHFGYDSCWVRDWLTMTFKVTCTLVYFVIFLSGTQYTTDQLPKKNSAFICLYWICWNQPHPQPYHDKEGENFTSPHCWSICRGINSSFPHKMQLVHKVFLYNSIAMSSRNYRVFVALIHNMTMTNQSAYHNVQHDILYYQVDDLEDNHSYWSIKISQYYQGIKNKERQFQHKSHNDRLQGLAEAISLTSGLCRNGREKLMTDQQDKWYIKYFCPVNINTQIAKFMGPTWGPPGSCRPQMGPMLAQWSLLSGYINFQYNAFLR